MGFRKKKRESVWGKEKRTVLEGIMTQRVDYVELTKNIGLNRSVKSETLSLRGHFIRSGVLCKDCKKYVARVRHSVCTRCYDRRVQKLLKSGGVYVLTPKTEKQIRREFRA